MCRNGNNKIKQDFYYIKCKSCENEFISGGRNIQRIESCGCSRRKWEESSCKEIGNKYNRLTIESFNLEKTEESYKAGTKHKFYNCLCECGNKVVVDIGALKTGHTKSCGCIKINNPLIMEDLTGRQFGRLTVIRRDEERDFGNIKRGKNGNVHWICRCQCGNQSSVTGYQLKSGGTQSCGCIVSEMTAKRNRECSSKYNHPEKYKDNILADSDINNVLKIYNQERTEFFLIDEQDYELIKKWYWHKEHKKGYWISNEKVETIKSGGKFTLRLHQLIAEAKFGKFDTKKLVPDHLSRDTNDNRRCNLVLKTYMDNSHNRGLSKANTSGKTGVYLDKESGKYVANITVNYHTKFLGYYKSFEEAVEVRKQAEEQYGFTCDDVKPDYDYKTAI